MINPIAILLFLESIEAMCEVLLMFALQIVFFFLFVVLAILILRAIGKAIGAVVDQFFKPWLR